MLINCNNNAIHMPSSECNSCENFADQLSQKQDKLTAGAGIDITGNTISVLSNLNAEVRIASYEAVDNLKIAGGGATDVSFSGVPDQTFTVVEDGVTKTFTLVDIPAPLNVRIMNGSVNGYLSSYCLVTNIHSTGCHIFNTSPSSTAIVRVSAAWLYQLTSIS